MQYAEACKEAIQATQVNLGVIESLLEELEDFDGLVDSPLWGSLQEKLIGIQQEYKLAANEFEKAILEATEESEQEIDDVLTQVTEQLRGELASILATAAGGKAIQINVEVSPTTTLH